MSLIFICISPFLVLGISVVFFLIFKKIIRREKELVKVINQAPNKEFAYNKIAKLAEIETNTQNTNNLNIRILNFLENDERFREIIKADSILEISPNDYENFVDAVSERAELSIPSNINKQELFKFIFDYVYTIDFKESLEIGGINIYKQLSKEAGSRRTFVLDFFPYFRLEQLGNVTLFYLLCMLLCLNIAFIHYQDIGGFTRSLSLIFTFLLSMSSILVTVSSASRLAIKYFSKGILLKGTLVFIQNQLLMLFLGGPFLLIYTFSFYQIGEQPMPPYSYPLIIFVILLTVLIIIRPKISLYKKLSDELFLRLLQNTVVE